MLSVEENVTWPSFLLCRRQCHSPLPDFLLRPDWTGSVCGVVGEETARSWCWPDAVLDCSCWATGKHSVCESLIHNLREEEEEEETTAVNGCTFIIWHQMLVYKTTNTSPSHFNPWRTRPHSISPQWLQKVGVRYDWTTRECGRILILVTDADPESDRDTIKRWHTVW